jgi:hypothetical protein
MRVYNKFVLRSNVNGNCVYLGKQGALTPNFKEATRFSRAEVKQIAEMVVTPNPFIVTPVAR